MLDFDVPSRPADRQHSALDRAAQSAFAQVVGDDDEVVVDSGQPVLLSLYGRPCGRGTRDHLHVGRKLPPAPGRIGERHDPLVNQALPHRLRRLTPRGGPGEDPGGAGGLDFPVRVLRGAEDVGLDPTEVGVHRPGDPLNRGRVRDRLHGLGDERLVAVQVGQRGGPARVVRLGHHRAGSWPFLAGQALDQGLDGLAELLDSAEFGGLLLGGQVATEAVGDRLDERGFEVAVEVGERSGDGVEEVRVGGHANLPGELFPSGERLPGRVPAVAELRLVHAVPIQAGMTGYQGGGGAGFLLFGRAVVRRLLIASGRL
ncbi:hypothetical protein [Acrocarpospora sp. B8E8]|uniref:hypothetical protein n=1 Tax=Acrocarpospora sp. B8E8 TaxID=3153572 RepID=UPI00325D6DAA